jgi:TRAP-type mannitol/chloroaromatic compound transport system permease large subunit
MTGLMSLGLFLAAGISLLAGFPVAFTLAGVALIFALLGVMTGTFDPAFLTAFPNRIFGIMSNETLIAVPVFVFMGVMLERSKLADHLRSHVGGYTDGSKYRYCRCNGSHHGLALFADHVTK